MLMHLGIFVAVIYIIIGAVYTSVTVINEAKRKAILMDYVWGVPLWPLLLFITQKMENY